MQPQRHAAKSSQCDATAWTARCGIADRREAHCGFHWKFCVPGPCRADQERYQPPGAAHPGAGAGRFFAGKEE